MPEENFVFLIKQPLPSYYQYLQMSFPENIKTFSKNIERCILANLYTRHLDLLMPIMEIVNIEGELPDCMQEALVLYAIFNNDFAVLERFKINETLEENVIYCVNECNKYRNNPKLVEEKLRNDYKGTYCYFYFFANPNPN